MKTFEAGAPETLHPGSVGGREFEHALDAAFGGAAAEVFVERDDLVGPRGQERVADFFQRVELHVGAEAAAADEMFFSGASTWRRPTRPHSVSMRKYGAASPFTYFIIAPVLPTKSAAAATSGVHSGCETTLRPGNGAGLGDVAA
jgi:hypothetical protein